MRRTQSDSSYVKAVKALRGKIFDNTQLKDSIYERATVYFQYREAEISRKQVAADKVAEQQKLLSENTDPKLQKSIQQTLTTLERELKKITREQENERVERHDHFVTVCHEVLELVEGEDFKDTVKKTAKLLGSLLLITPAHGRYVQPENEKSKHLYKAALCLRLTDRLILEGNMMSNFILKHCNNENIDEETESFKNDDFRENVQIPIIMAALLQDIGNYHPDAQHILKGKDGKLDPYRPLTPEERKLLLKINYRETLKYVTAGIGPGRYIGNSKQEREVYNQEQNTKLKFIRTLLKSWVNPENGIGNLLKIPQVYTSLILSTKPNYDYKLLPKAYNVLGDSAMRGSLNKTTVKAFLTIVGKFPQGYGITYIPRDSDNLDLERYEYAIVTQLYPQDAQIPTCRQATKNLQYSHSGIDYIMGVNNNLYFAPTRKKLERVGELRLKEILQLLSSNYTDGSELELIPSCWHPSDFFSFAKNQNLWNQMDKRSLL
jgi:hypothetical protein